MSAGECGGKRDGKRPDAETRARTADFQLAGPAVSQKKEKVKEDKWDNLSTPQPCWIMGNHTGKSSHAPTGSPLDFYHTPPTSPSEAELAAMALPAAASTDQAQTPSLLDSATPSASPAGDWTQKLSAPLEWAVISLDSITSTETNVSNAGARQDKAVFGLDSPAPLPSEQSWQERDSGMEPQSAAERAGEEVTLVLLGLMERYRVSVGLTPGSDATKGAVELLRRLIKEREELVEEVDTLRETLRTERLEWHQFQCDLQVAVSVAERLRGESEQELGLLQQSHRAVEEQLARALGRQQETEQELERLRAEHKHVCCQLSEYAAKEQQQQQQQAELALMTNISTLEDGEESEEGQRTKKQKITDEAEANSEAKDESETNQDGDEGEAHDPGRVDGSGNGELTGKGVAEGYIRSLAALEKRKEERGQRDPRRIVMLCERSWSLSGLPLQTDSSNKNDTSKNTSTTLPLCKKEEPTKGKRMDRILQRQDSWSSFYTGKQEEDQIFDSTKPQDSFSALLRRHGGSRRNSLLRWCQSRTQGYKNIEITNFSSSWEDGMAFCAVYHTYLPKHIPYESLNPAEKKDNLDLAFKTGESVGITATVAAEDMLKPDGPDWQRVLGYVESIFRHFEM
ncbi:cytospin-A-like [Cololabis saira]|uniref:cytospin-A-like n=1 Tax=Cololabis saira TaxID=129043 RepID=UPI002AD338EF|nr:cytospin-A-like [Cololabis saira]